MRLQPVLLPLLGLLLLATQACFPTLPEPDDDIIADTTIPADTGPDATPDSESDATPPDVQADSLPGDIPAEDDTIAPQPNTCGGSGPLEGPTPGAPCGPCADGLGVCDPTDANRNRAICANATPLNTCGGCADLDGNPGDACGDCGVWKCDTAGTGKVFCETPTIGCQTFLSCDTLDCGFAGRSCIDGGGLEDATCGGCLEGFVLRGDACLFAGTPPTGLTASEDVVDRVVLTWEPQTSVSGWRVWRCSANPCTEADWTQLPNGEVAVPRYEDTSAEALPAPGAPLPTASDDDPRHVVVAWPAVAPAVARRYTYRVTAVAPAGETAPSETVVGARASAPVQGYEVKAGDGPWVHVGEATTWTDTNAPDPKLSLGSVTASQGTFALHVALAVTGTSTAPGVVVPYQVRAVGPSGTSAESAVISGRRGAPPTWTIQWERSANASPDDFSLIPSSNGNTWNDTDAPADGGTRFYRAVLTFAGGIEARSDAVSGYRQPPPNVPNGVTATTELEDRVDVSWNAVSGALGYHVYRNGTKMTSGNGLSTTSWTDTAAPAPSGNWAAPSGVNATTNDTEKVTVVWTAPTRPVGTAVTYEVSAVNASGESVRSAAVQGRRSRPRLTGYEVEVAIGQNVNWVTTGSTLTSWVHATAPAAILSATTTVTDGDHRLHVRLTSSHVVVTQTDVLYRVRGRLENGNVIPTSSQVTGRRAVGTVTRQWRRSETTTFGAASALSGATTATWNDTAAPADGTARWYQLQLSAPGAQTAEIGPTIGRRLAFSQLSSGSDHHCATAVGGRVWCWGQQRNGRLGNGLTDTATITTPVRVPNLFDVVEVSAGSSHSCARLTNKEIWCWGYNLHGQLGDGSDTTRTAAVKVVGITTANQVSSGSSTTCARLDNGTLRCWGMNAFWQVGDGTQTNRSTPVNVKLSAYSDLTSAQHLASSVFSFTYCTTRTGASLGARCWGFQLDRGQLGNGSGGWNDYPVLVSSSTLFTTIAAARYTSCAIDSNSAMFCWGYNDEGQLGVGDKVMRTTPAAVTFANFIPAGMALSSNETCALSTAGAVRCWGKAWNRTSPPTSNQSGLSNVVAISAHASGFCALASQTIKCWPAGGTVADVPLP